MSMLNTKAEVIAALQESNQRATEWFLEISADTFFTRQGKTWSASDNLDHLIRSHKPLTKALKLPKFTLQAIFGKAERESMAYEELCHIYRDEIARGAQASGRFLPNQEDPAERAEQKKKEVLEQWLRAGRELVSAAEKWGEYDLDQYQLPHPILGNLTIREMLYFAIYHNLRHASREGD